MSMLGMSVGMPSRVPDVRPRRIVVGLTALIGVVGVGVVAAPQRGAAIAEAAVRSIDAMALMDARSPGSRPAGALYQTKPNLAPREAWSSSVRPRVPVSGTPDAPSGFAPLAGVPIDGVVEPGGGFVFTDVPPPATGGFGGTGGLPVFGGGGGIGGVVIGGGGGGIGGGGGQEPSNPGGGTTTPMPTSPVPEPATWLTMVLGFGMMGSTLRRRRGFAGAA